MKNFIIFCKFIKKEKHKVHPNHTAKKTREWLRDNSVNPGVAQPESKLKPYGTSWERPENGCLPIVPIQPD